MVVGNSIPHLDIVTHNTFYTNHGVWWSVIRYHTSRQIFIFESWKYFEVRTGIITPKTFLVFSVNIYFIVGIGQDIVRQGMPSRDSK